MAIVFVFLAVLLRSRFGRALAGIRVNEQRMRSIGFPVVHYKLGAFVVACNEPALRTAYVRTFGVLFGLYWPAAIAFCAVWLAVAALTREQMQAFHATWFKPNNATLVAVGATTGFTLTSLFSAS